MYDLYRALIVGGITLVALFALVRLLLYCWRLRADVDWMEECARYNIEKLAGELEECRAEVNNHCLNDMLQIMDSYLDAARSKAKAAEKSVLAVRRSWLFKQSVELCGDGFTARYLISLGQEMLGSGNKPWRYRYDSVHSIIDRFGQWMFRSRSKHIRK